LRVVVDHARSAVRMLRAAGLTGALMLFRELDDALAAAADTPGRIVEFGA
jgi:hypothetical protein